VLLLSVLICVGLLVPALRAARETPRFGRPILTSLPDESRRKTPVNGMSMIATINWSPRNLSGPLSNRNSLVGGGAHFPSMLYVESIDSVGTGSSQNNSLLLRGEGVDVTTSYSGDFVNFEFEATIRGERYRFGFDCREGDDTIPPNAIRYLESFRDR